MEKCLHRPCLGEEEDSRNTHGCTVERIQSLGRMASIESGSLYLVLPLSSHERQTNSERESCAIVNRQFSLCRQLHSRRSMLSKEKGRRTGATDVSCESACACVHARMCVCVCRPQMMTEDNNAYPPPFIIDSTEALFFRIFIRFRFSRV